MEDLDNFSGDLAFSGTEKSTSAKSHPRKPVGTMAPQTVNIIQSKDSQTPSRP